MNFKPNLLKVIVSIISGILLSYPLSIIKVIGGWNEYSEIYLQGWIVIALIFAVLIYLIWSLIQKKK